MTHQDPALQTHGLPGVAPSPQGLKDITGFGRKHLRLTYHMTPGNPVGIKIAMDISHKLIEYSETLKHAITLEMALSCPRRQ